MYHVIYMLALQNFCCHRSSRHLFIYFRAFCIIFIYMLTLQSRLVKNVEVKDYVKYIWERENNCFLYWHDRKKVRNVAN